MNKARPLGNINIKFLKAFVSIVETGSFHKSATVLYTSVPALVNQMKQVEEFFDTPLLVKYGKGKVPTKAGFVLYERAKELIRLNDNIIIEVRETGNAPEPDNSFYHIIP